MIIVWPIGANQPAEYFGLGYVEAFNSGVGPTTTPVDGPAAWVQGEVYLLGFQEGEVSD